MKVLPPIRLSEAGRPRQASVRDADEPTKGGRGPNKYGKCNRYGHNARSCQRGPTSSQMRKSRGGASSRGGRPKSVPESIETQLQKKVSLRRRQEQLVNLEHLVLHLSLLGEDQSYQLGELKLHLGLHH